MFGLQAATPAATDVSTASEPSRLGVPLPGGAQSDQSVQVGVAFGNELSYAANYGTGA